MRAIHVVAILCLLLFAAYVAPFLTSHSAQDQCSFGPASNEKYLALLSEAKRRHAATWPPLVWDNQRTGHLLDARFDDLSAGSGTIYDRLATAHAIIRAMGGDYRNTNSDHSEDPYSDVLNRGDISIHYQVDVNRLGFFQPVGRQMWLIVSLVGPKHQLLQPSEPHSKPGDIRFIVHFPNFFEGYYHIPKSTLGGSCPPIPKSDIATQFAP
jgi:hypothetical protein